MPRFGGGVNPALVGLTFSYGSFPFDVAVDYVPPRTTLRIRCNTTPPGPASLQQPCLPCAGRGVWRILDLRGLGQDLYSNY